MQSLATYSLTHTSTSSDEAESLLQACDARVQKWLAQKGELADGTLQLVLGNRPASLVAATHASSQGILKEWELTEPLKDAPTAEFRTSLQLAQQRETVRLYLTLKAGYRATVIAPELPVTVKPPRILFDLCDIPKASWHFGEMPVGLKPLTLGAEHSDVMINWLSNTRRPIPIVALSEYDGEILHPQPTWQEKVVERLFGMALVVRLTSDLSWELTERIGKEWSCYHGAVRIYWPGLRFDGDPFRHDLMTADSIMGHFATTDRATAANRLLDQLFERFRRISTFSVRCPSIFTELRRSSSLDRITELRRKVTAKGDATKAAADLAAKNRQLAEELAASQQLSDELTKETTRLESELEDASNELARLRNELDNERLLRGSAAPTASAPPVQQQSQPTTVAEAIQRAKQTLSADLIFGADIDSEASQLKEDAGPPSRVSAHLAKLAEVSRLLRAELEATGSASLGKPICDWLKGHGVGASGEYPLTMSNRAERTARTWDFGNGNTHVYEKHTKPNEATSPNQCVRIYFEWCEKRKKIVIGSVGRKPGL